MAIGPRPKWWDNAACLGMTPDFFYPETKEATAIAKRICALCSERQACLEYALDAGEKHGVWGGMCERERRALGSIRHGILISA